MAEHIRNIVKGGPLFGYLTEGDSLAFGSAALEAATRGLEDRNRTAPFPFCGNRFEFRAVRHALPSDRRSRRRVVVALPLSGEDPKTLRPRFFARESRRSARRRTSRSRWRTSTRRWPTAAPR